MSYFVLLCNNMRLIKDLFSSFLQLKEKNSDKSKITAWLHDPKRISVGLEKLEFDG